MFKSKILDLAMQRMSTYTIHETGHFATDIFIYVSKCLPHEQKWKFLTGSIWVLIVKVQL